MNYKLEYINTQNKLEYINTKLIKSFENCRKLSARRNYFKKIFSSRNYIQTIKI